MNALKVECYNEKLMELADEEFKIVIHSPEDCSNQNYTGEFIIYDTMSEKKIEDKVKKMHNSLSKKEA